MDAVWAALLVGDRAALKHCIHAILTLRRLTSMKIWLLSAPDGVPRHAASLAGSLSTFGDAIAVVRHIDFSVDHVKWRLDFNNVRNAHHLCRSRRWSGTAKNRATFCRSRSVQIRTPQAGSMARRAESLRPISATSPTRQAPSSKRERAPKVRLATALKTTETAMAKT